MPNTLGPSEFEGTGVRPFGGFNLLSAVDKARYARRTELDPEISTDLDAPADRWRHGGVPEHTTPDWWIIR